MNIAKKIVDALKSKKQPSAYDTQAEVRRIENGTAWVRLAGGTTETPVQMSIDAKPGDTVIVRLSGGKAWITGNNTAPPTDDGTAIEIGGELYRLKKKTKETEKGIWEGIETADERAIEAQRSADGKSTIFYTSDVPTSGMKENDTWFNPNEDNAIYRYDGTAWAKEELGEDAIADLSITNAKIANATIQSAKIANLDAAKITSGTIDTARLNVAGIITAGGIATEDELPTKLSDLDNDEGFITDADVSGKADKSDAVAEEQTIYKSATSGTSSMSGTTTWIADVTGAQNTWTLKRPAYSSSYPVLFVAKQKKTVSGTVTCTTPLMDDTTTVIDGGHITTGSIDAARISAGSFTMTGGSIDMETSTETEDKIQLQYQNQSTSDVFMNMMQAKSSYMIYAERKNGRAFEQASARLSGSGALNLTVRDDTTMAFQKKRSISIDASEDISGTRAPRIRVNTHKSSGAVDKSTVIGAGEISLNGTDIFQLIYPVGAIYISTASTDPGTLFGGTWQQIEDMFLLAAGSTYSAGATGGDATVTLTAAQSGLPAHTHAFTQPTVKTTLNFLKDAQSGTNKNRVTSGSADDPDANTTYTANVTGGAVGAVTGGAKAASAAHNNMPPYLAVYVWKRTA